MWLLSKKAPILINHIENTWDSMINTESVIQVEKSCKLIEQETYAYPRVGWGLLNLPLHSFQSKMPIHVRVMGIFDPIFRITNRGTSQSLNLYFSRFFKIILDLIILCSQGACQIHLEGGGGAPMRALSPIRSYFMGKKISEEQ